MAVKQATPKKRSDYSTQVRSGRSVKAPNYYKLAAEQSKQMGVPISQTPAFKKQLSINTKAAHESPGFFGGLGGALENTVLGGIGGRPTTGQTIGSSASNLVHNLGFGDKGMVRRNGKWVPANSTSSSGGKSKNSSKGKTTNAQPESEYQSLLEPLTMQTIYSQTIAPLLKTLAAQNQTFGNNYQQLMSGVLNSGTLPTSYANLIKSQVPQTSDLLKLMGGSDLQATAAAPMTDQLVQQMNKQQSSTSDLSDTLKNLMSIYGLASGTAGLTGLGGKVSGASLGGQSPTTPNFNFKKSLANAGLSN